jgi:hypothetical protein
MRYAVLPGRSLGQPVHEQRHTGRAGHRAGYVDGAWSARRFGQHPGRRGGHHDPDRDVDEEHPPPGQVGGQYPAQQQADRGAGAGHRRVDAKRPVARGAFGKVGGNQRQRGRRDDRAASALEGPRGQQPPLASGEPTEQGRSGEQQQPEDEYPPPAQPVARAAAEQEQTAEGDRVGVHDPLQAGAGEVERALHMRQRHIDDGAVEHDHQLGGCNDHQSQAEAAVASAGCRVE